jgi:hypothetical protein
MILLDALDVAADRILSHRVRLFERVALSYQAGEGRAGNDESAFFGGFE